MVLVSILELLLALLMPLVIRTEKVPSDLLSCPRVQCDHCGDIIDDPLLGMVTWSEPAKAGDISALRFIHKKFACKKTEGYPDDPYWMQLDHFLARLLHNLQLDEGKLQAIKRLIEQL
jgi:hypothetical protein